MALLRAHAEPPDVPRRVMIAGTIAGSAPNYGGDTHSLLPYLVGFRRLGFEVFYVEDFRRETYLDAGRNPTSFGGSAGVEYFSEIVRRFDLDGRAALLGNGDHHVGLSLEECEKIASDVDLFINRSGRFHLYSVPRRARRRMYLDVDPGYTQVWQHAYGVDMNLREQDVYVTVGLNVGEPDCPFPTCGIRWEKTLPPVVLDEWANDLPPGAAYSTVADWRGFASIEWAGVSYGQKCDAFLRILDLPRRVAVPLELCLLIAAHDPDRVKLIENGWRLADPAVHTATPDAYHRYVVGSRGEVSAVKPGYSAARTGWFSDRSACYLAAGRPVIVEDTGFGAHVPTGAGVLAFTDVESAAAAIDDVERDYSRHARAARAFAREHLDSDRVLARLLTLAP
ncbi:MAG: glycosyltransferase [Candidatus Binatia bacterium]